MPQQTVFFVVEVFVFFKFSYMCCVLLSKIIQVPQGRFKVLAPELTRTGPYPVALIPGQFQDYYKKYGTH